MTNHHAERTIRHQSQLAELYAALVECRSVLSGCLNGTSDRRDIEFAEKLAGKAIESAAGGPVDADGERW